MYIWKHTAGLSVVLCLTLLQVYCTAPDAFLSDNPNDPISLAFQPSQPTTLVAHPASGEVLLVWSDRSNHEDGYVVEKAFRSSFTDEPAFDELTRLPVDTENFIDTAFGQDLIVDCNNPNQIVSYRVGAFAQREDNFNVAWSPVQNVTLTGLLTRRSQFIEPDGDYVISWSGTSVILEGYTVELQKAGAFEEIARLPKNVETFISGASDVADLMPGDLVIFRINMYTVCNAEERVLATIEANFGRR